MERLAWFLFGVVTAVIAVVLLSFVITSARDPAVVAAFRKTHPCPVTGKTTGACPGYVVDHPYPLCAGGADTVDNMMWQERAQSYVKDRLERELCQCLKKTPASP